MTKRNKSHSWKMACALVAASFLSPAQGHAADALLVKHARFFTMADGQRKPFTGYMLVSDDGRITEIKEGDPSADNHARQVFDAHGEWVIPGFISAHSHLWQAAYRGVAADKTLLSWIDSIYLKYGAKATPEDMYWFCMLGALDHLQAGITAAYNFNYARITWTATDNAFDEAQFRAEEASGIRYVHGYEPGWFGPEASIEKAETRLEEFQRWTSAQHPSSRFLSIMLNGDTAFNTTYQQAVMEKALMDRFGLSNQSHYLEPPEKVTQELERR